MTVALVLLGGAVGAPLRYLVDLLVRSRNRSGFPWGTFLVNVTGSLALGVLMGVVGSGDAPTWLVPLVGTGVCGAFTTFSTFGFETVRLLEEGEARTAAANSLGSLAVGLGAFAAGHAATVALLA
ncbi:MAG: fluoride efflux transporter CrcB [Actinomycetes bacterium]